MGDMNFIKHKPVDRSDPGFTIPGQKLRWVSGSVAENNPGRPWAVLRKSKMPKELVEHLKDVNPFAFQDGDTIRRGDLVLAYAPIEHANEFRKEILERAQEQEMLVKRGPDVNFRNGSYAKVEVNEEHDSTEEMIARFKKERQ